LSTERDDALFRALVEGEIAESSAEVREMFARDPQREHEWEETKELLAALDESRRARQEVLDHATKLAKAPGSDRAEQALRAAMLRAAPARAADEHNVGDHLSDPQHAHASSRRQAAPMARAWVWVAAAAVMLLVLVWRPWKPQDGVDHGAMLLGSQKIQTKTTFDAATGAPCFEWIAEVAPGSTFTIIIDGRESNSESWRPLIEQKSVSLDKWCPPKDAVASWPSRIRWRVVAMEPSALGQLPSDWSEVSLRH
jgi:hypothetical protein